MCFKKSAGERRWRHSTESAGGGDRVKSTDCACRCKGTISSVNGRGGGTSSVTRCALALKATWVVIGIVVDDFRRLDSERVAIGDSLDMAGQHIVCEKLHDGVDRQIDQ